jgi:predicted homoserine dehydrogenase-like protein
MIYRQMFDLIAKGMIVRAGLIGAGDFATAIVTQASAIRRLDLPVVAELQVELARKAFLLAGYAAEDIALCSSRAQALQALERGRRVVVPDAMLMMDLPLDVVIECTGIPEAGARYCEEAIRHGKHVANVSKELDVVIGPMLKHLADRAGVVYTTVDGDQPGLLIGLIEWAQELGLEVLCAGKARDTEFIHEPAAQTVREGSQFNPWAEPAADGRASIVIDPTAAPALSPIASGQAAEVVAARNALFRGLFQIQGFDLAEMAIVANATSLVPDVEGLHCPPLRTTEIAEVLCPIEEGGILQHRGVVDAVTILRGPHEAGMGGGVFIVVACENDYSRRTLTHKGLIPNSRGTTMLIYRPHHLCGVETPMSALCAGLLKVPTGATELKPRFDVIARTTRDLKAGEPAGYELDFSDLPRLWAYLGRLKASMCPAQPVGPGQPLPLFMAHEARLTVDAPAGTTITADMVTRPADSRLWALREEQDKLFLGNA